MYYFGCWQDSGHYLWKPGMWKEDFKKCPVGNDIDTGFCPKDTTEEGKAALHFVNGWTILSFWDRSQDTRHGSHSTFLWEGQHTFDEILEQAKKVFPGVFSRFDFEVTLHGNV